jgi:O-antigen ligase
VLVASHPDPASERVSARVAEGSIRVEEAVLTAVLALVPWEVTKSVVPILRVQDVGGGTVSFFDLSRMVSVLALLLLPLAAIHARGRYQKLALIGAVILFVGFGIGALGAPEAGGAVSEMVRLVFNLLLLLSFACLPLRVRGVRLPLRAFCWSMTASALVLLANKMTGIYLWNSALAPSGRANGAFADPNIAARFLLIAMVISFLVPPGGRWAQLGWRWIEPTIAAMAILATGSRSVILLGAGLIIPALILGDPGVRRAVLGAITPLLLIGMVAFAALPSLAERLRTVADPITVLGSRRSLITAAWAMFLDHPWFGVGLGGFGPNLLDRYARYQGYYGTAQTRSHTSVMTTLAELGVLGALLMAGTLIATFALGWIVHRRGHPQLRRPALALVLGVVVIFVASQSEGRFWEEPLLWIFLGLLVASTSIPIRQR